MGFLRFLPVYVCVAVLWVRTDGRTVTLAVLTPLSGPRSMGRELTIAVDIAIRKANTDPSLVYMRAQNITMDYILADTMCEIGTGLYQLVELEEQVDAFIGPVCDALCQPAGRLCGKWNKPMISYSCASADLMDRKLYPTFLRTSPVYEAMRFFLVDLIKHFKWESLVLVQGPHSIWTETVSVYQPYLENQGITADILSLPENDPHDILERHLLHEAEITRVFVVLAYGEDVLYLMCAAETAGLLNGDYVFITIDFSFMTTATLAGRPCNSARVMEGVIDITIEIDQDYQGYENFVYEMTNNSHFEHAFEAGLHAGMLYDAVYLYTIALNAALEHGDNWSNGTEMVSRLTNQSFQGITGNVILDEHGSRTCQFMAHNIFHGRYTSFARSDGSLGDIVLLENARIVWPGGSSDVPLGRPACGWNNEHCQDETSLMPIYTAVGVSLVLVLTMTSGSVFYWYKRKERQEKMESMSWKISYADLVFKVHSKLTNSSLGSKGTFHSRTINHSAETISARRSFDSAISNAGQLFTKIATYKDVIVAVKFIKKPYIAITQSVIQEINEVRSLKHRNVNPLIGACTDPMKICLLSVYCGKGSLIDVLENDDVKLDQIFKVSFASDIAKGMSYIHAEGLKTHGRLKSSNVFIDGHWTCKVGDFAMPVFREGERIGSEEGRKEMYQLLWTAPELLRKPGDHPRGTQKGDVYAYGIILQEIILRTGPFSMMDIEPEDIVRKVEKQEHPPFRPKLAAEERDGFLSDMMSMCWEEVPLFRPSFPTILQTLKKDNQGRTTNLVDQMVHMMSKYADHLEELVKERTEQLELEQKRTEDLLCRMLPRSIANELKQGNHVVPKTYDAVTIFFSDIVGFTALASGSTPMEVVNFLNDLYTCFDRIIENYDVYKVETIGDAYMVVSGMPQKNAKHAGEIAIMALDLLSSVTVFKIRHRPEKQLQLRIGIHSGPVAAGVVGQKMPRYCLFGDTVNYASRMESTGLALRIHVSPECKEILDDIGGFYFECRGYTEMKGKGQIKTYFLLGREGFMGPTPDLQKAASLEEHTFK